MNQRVVVITGSAGGIGSALVERFRTAGDTVIGLDLVDGFDITNPSDVQRTTESILAEHGRIDLLCNNAGVGAVGDVVEATPEDWTRVFSVNVFGLAQMSRTVLPAMRAAKQGAIVNISSVAALVGLVDRAVYSASKGAVLALTRAMAADEVTHGITVNCVCPGTVDGPWVRRLIAAEENPEGAYEALRRRQPLGRLVTADEVAATVDYLAAAPTFTTGEAIALDGGIAALRLVD
jgi:2-keto-3-deoxy-L-fuconate dehydrogenase